MLPLGAMLTPEGSKVSTPSLSTTSYAVLGLLAVKPWSSYELTQQMDRSLGRIWPRAVSKLYEEPKKLVTHGLARASAEMNGQRTRTVYAITPKGRRALRRWLAEPGDGPSLEFEQMVKVLFAEHATTPDLRRTLTAVDSWAGERCAESLAVGEQYLHGRGPFPERLPELMLTSRFLTDFYLFLREWAQWASALVESWPDDPQQAKHDQDELAETVRRAGTGATSTDAS
jgi:PadR family transcriptional regulator, regulatory protein AphA